MSCHICGQEAIDRCYTCGQLFCADHGSVDCSRCESGIIAGDNRADRISASRLRDDSGGVRSPWWRARQAEEYDPPACHICQGLARRVCQNCQQHYCAEHAGPTHLCQTCGRSSMLGIWCMIGGFLGLFGLIFWGTVYESLGYQQRVWLGTIVAYGLLGLAAYLVLGYSCRNLFRSAGRPGWLGFVPILNVAVLLELSGKPSWWALLYVLGPMIGAAIIVTQLYYLFALLAAAPLIALQVVLGLGLARSFGKSSAFGIGLALLWIVFLPFLAFGKPVYQPVSRKEQRIQ